MKTLACSLFFAVLLATTFQSCQNDGNNDTDKKTNTDTLPNLQSRTSSAKNLSAEELFFDFPNESFHLEGWEKLNAKYRKQLIQKGSIDALSATVKGNHVRIVEKFQNEDDENERAAQLDMIVFRHSEEDYNIVFVSQKYVHEDQHKGDELVSQYLWQFNGKEWVDITEIMPDVNTAMFFEKDFDVSAAKTDFIAFGPSDVNENTLSASLLYESYGKFGLKPEKLIPNEAFTVNLIWNGQSFEVQRKPNVLN